MINEQQFLVLQSLAETYGQYFYRSLDDYTLGDPIIKVVDNEDDSLTEWLISVHELLGIQMEYLPFEEKKVFLTLKDVFVYFVNLIVKKDQVLAF